MRSQEKTIMEMAVNLTVELTAILENVQGKAVFVNQILRSCSSIGANAYEANYAQSRADFVNKLEVSLKECHETEYWLEVLYRTGALSLEIYKAESQQCGKIRRKLISAITKTKEKGI